MSTDRRAAGSRLVALLVSLPARLALGLLWGYRHLVSPLLPRSCRYYPSCSAYAEQAVRTHGVVRGSWLALRRLGRCHPWTPGGVDHVPPRRGDVAGEPSGPVPAASDSTSTGA
jgi:putative membrane protein insertion efficiency factor